MNRSLVIVGAGALVLAAGIAVVAVARAQPRSFPDPTEVQPSGMAAQMQEPPTGFTGACLLDHATYQPTLPLICYTPPSTVQDGAGTTTVSFPANKVADSYSSLPASYDSYQVLATCFPRQSDGTCPQQSFAVSLSCCDYGTRLTSLDGQTASGLAIFR